MDQLLPTMQQRENEKEDKLAGIEVLDHYPNVVQDGKIRMMSKDDYAKFCNRVNPQRRRT